MLVESGAEGSRAAKEEEEVKNAVALSQTEGAVPRKTIWLMPAGSRGDIQPMIALGAGLRKAGFHVRVLSGPFAKPMAEAAGLTFTKQGVDYFEEVTKAKDELWSTTNASEAAVENEEGALGEKMLAKWNADDKWVKSSARIINDLLKEEVPDFVFAWFSILKCLPFIIRNKCKIPVYNFEYQAEWFVPLDPDPAKELARCQEKMDSWSSVREGIIEEIGIDPLEGFTPEVFKEWRDSCSYAFCTSQVVQGYSPDIRYWTSVVRSEAWFKSYFKGYLILDPATQTKDLSSFGGIETLRKLHDFIKAGPPPVYLGWGSIPVPTGHLLKALAAMKLCKYRGIVCAGWAGLTYEKVTADLKAVMPEDPYGLVEFMNANVVWVNVANHEWLFPRCALTVHHGGAGTTAAAMRAGVPTLVTPLGVDQFFFANLVETVGVGGRLSATEGAEKLMDPAWSKMFRKLVTSKEIAAKCKEAAAYLRAECENTIPSMVEELNSIIDKHRAAKTHEAAS